MRRTAILPLLILGCTVGPDYRAPEVASPAGWTERDPAKTSGSEASSLIAWWKEFRDPTLDSLIAEALEANLGLAQALERIVQSRADRAAVMAGFFPRLSGSASFTNSRLSKNGFLKSIAEGVVPQPGAVVPGSEINLYQAGFDAVWELDLFGRTRRSAEAADADLAARIEGARGVLVSLIAEIGRTYVELRTVEERLNVARRSVAAQEDSLAVVRDRRGAGVSSDLDVARAEARLEALRAELPALESARRRAVHGLELLLSRGTLGSDRLPPGPVPAPPEKVAVGIPADLLRRRPDLRMAERELAAATARIGVAEADLYPRLTLAGAIGLQSQTPGDFARWDSRFWSAGPSLLVPIFEGGRLRARVEIQESLAKEALLRYREAVLRSHAEVESALAAYGQEGLRRRALAARVDAEARAVRWARDLYANGLSDYLPVLDAMRSLNEAEDALAESSGTRITALIALYKALGGGWNPGGPQPAE